LLRNGPVILAPERTETDRLARKLAAEHYAIERRHLIAGGLTVEALAERFGTPLYIFDAAVMRRSFNALKSALSGFADVVFSIKANPNPAIARIFVELGAGIEIASLGEYERAREAGAAPRDILFAGPGKRDNELERVIRDGIGEIHLECLEEIARADAIAARAGKRVAVSIRINPVAAAQGGAMRMGGKPSPFGFDEEQIPEVLTVIAASSQLDLCGVHLFAGTQILDAEVLLNQWRHGLDVAARVARAVNRPLRSIDLGGGLGIPYYAGDHALDLDAVRLGAGELARVKESDPMIRDARVVVEPGRYLTGPGGLYVARVIASKLSRGARFIVTDGGMHHHLAASGNLGQVVKRDYPVLAPAHMDATEFERGTVVGPLCTPLDTLARAANLPPLRAGDLVAIMQSGAYGISASPSGFLSHPRPAEILVDDGRAIAIG
jgi:diaminopimelate decarboxylase